MELGPQLPDDLTTLTYAELVAAGRQFAQVLENPRATEQAKDTAVEVERRE